MNSIGIDVSNGISTVIGLRTLGEVALTPRDVPHTLSALETLGYDIIRLGDDTRVIMEATGRYHEPVAAALHELGIFVCVVNPIVIKQSGAGSVRKVKNDKADARKIAKYGLDNWKDLREYTPVDAVRQMLKLFSRQYNFYMKTSVALQNNLISLLLKSFPGGHELFDSPTRADGHQKWVDFVTDFWHCDMINRVSTEAFTERYRKWCKHKGYHFSAAKAEDVYILSCGNCPTLPKNDITKLLITSAAKELADVRKTLMTVKAEVIRLAKQLPEYELVVSMYGVGEITGPQLIAELGDVRRFDNRGSIVAFAGIDPAVNQSGTYSRVSNPASKRGSPHLRKTLFQVVDTHLKRSPPDEPVYRFLDKKRAEGKPYYVYMTVAANKFLRIYYAQVKAFLNEHDPEQESLPL
jgi:transposase